MGWDTALTVSFTGSILISRDGSATVAVNHHQLRRVFQHPSALLGVVTMVCPLVEVRHRGSAFVSRYSTIRSHREESRALPSVRFSPRLASPRRPPTEAYREFRKQEIAIPNEIATSISTRFVVSDFFIAEEEFLLG